MTIAMQTTDKTLKEVLDALIELDLIPSSRVGPIKTAVKQYALILGCSEPAQCPLSAFHLQDRITQARVLSNLSSGRNLKRWIAAYHGIKKVLLHR